MGKAKGQKKKKEGMAGAQEETKAEDVEMAQLVLAKAKELRDEGNAQYKAKDYVGALQLYEQALNLLPEKHPDRAHIHSNRAAVLVSLVPPRYQEAVLECSVALEVLPHHPRALSRRARAYDALKKSAQALADVEELLKLEPDNADAKELLSRLQMMNSVPNGPTSQEASMPSLGARGPSLPPPRSKGRGLSKEDSEVSSVSSLLRTAPSTASEPKTLSPDQMERARADAAHLFQLQEADSPSLEGGAESAAGGADAAPGAAGPAQEASELGRGAEAAKGGVESAKGAAESASKPPRAEKVRKKNAKVAREKEERQPVPLKLLYEASGDLPVDLRLAEMPAGAGYSVLREVVKRRLPVSKSVLIKYRDNEGDWVTITCRTEVEKALTFNAERAAMTAQALAEPSAWGSRMAPPVPDSIKSIASDDSQPAKPPAPPVLRLKVVDCPPEQEPVVASDDEIPPQEDVLEAPPVEEEKVIDKPAVEPEKTARSANQELPAGTEGEHSREEVVVDDWLVEIAEHVKRRLGMLDYYDPMLYGEKAIHDAVNDVVTSDDALPLFETAGNKFQEVAMTGMLNWGHVHMCMARKLLADADRVDGEDERHRAQLAVVQEAEDHFKRAQEKFEQALEIRSDFCEASVALGQAMAEMAKLKLSLAIASKVDLKAWDAAPVLRLFHQAEDKFVAAVQVLKDLMQREEHGLAEERQAAESAAAASLEEAQPMNEAEQVQMSLQDYLNNVNLTWGHTLLEQSILEFKVGRNSWRKPLEGALTKFNSAGLPQETQDELLKNHPGYVEEKAILEKLALSHNVKSSVEDKSSGRSVSPERTRANSPNKAEGSTSQEPNVGVAVETDVEKVDEQQAGINASKANGAKPKKRKPKK